MTGKSHIVANGVIVFAATQNPTLTVSAMMAAKIPDQLEHFLPGVKHRTITHIFSMWLFLSILSMLFWKFGGASTEGWLGEVVFGFFLGAGLHVFMDMFSMSGVPLTRGYVYGFKVYRTGKGSEYIFLFFVMMVSVGWILAKEPSLLKEALTLLSKGFSS